jgi:hypothetical protein
MELWVKIFGSQTFQNLASQKGLGEIPELCTGNQRGLIQQALNMFTNVCKMQSVAVLNLVLWLFRRTCSDAHGFKASFTPRHFDMGTPILQAQLLTMHLDADLSCKTGNWGAHSPYPWSMLILGLCQLSFYMQYIVHDMIVR